MVILFTPSHSSYNSLKLAIEFLYCVLLRQLLFLKHTYFFLYTVICWSSWQSFDVQKFCLMIRQFLFWRVGPFFILVRMHVSQDGLSKDCQILNLTEESKVVVPCVWVIWNAQNAVIQGSTFHSVDMVFLGELPQLGKELQFQWKGHACVCNLPSHFT